MPFYLPYFVVFSSTFTSQNPIELPIELPTAATFSELVLDKSGKPVDAGSSYRIVSTLWGDGSGDVCLGDFPYCDQIAVGSG